MLSEEPAAEHHAESVLCIYSCNMQKLNKI